MTGTQKEKEIYFINCGRACWAGLADWRTHFQEGTIGKANTQE